jgi:hypothetical protein
MLFTQRNQFENFKMEACYDGPSPTAPEEEKSIWHDSKRKNQKTGAIETILSSSKISEMKAYLSQFRFNRFSNDTDFILVAIPTIGIFTGQFFTNFLNVLGMGAYATIGALIPIVAANTYFVRNKIGSSFLNRWNNRRLIKLSQEKDMVICNELERYPILEIATNPHLLTNKYLTNFATPRSANNDIESFIQNGDWDSIISILSHPKTSQDFVFASLTAVSDVLLQNGKEKNNQIFVKIIESIYEKLAVSDHDWENVIKLLSDDILSDNNYEPIVDILTRKHLPPSPTTAQEKLPPHITPEQVARVHENLAQLDIASQVNAALTTGSVSAAQKVGDAEISEINRILSTINANSQSTLAIAKGLIERLTPVSETIARSQKDIQLLRDNSLWGMARRAFNRLTVHRFAANVTANFNDIDRDVAQSRSTSISLIERFETLGSLGKLLDAPLMKINDTIETALGETPASAEVETVLRATQKHAMTLYALSQQAQQMVGMLVAGESNFATFTRGIGIANVATGLAQTVSDMAEKNRMVTGLTAPMNDQIASSMQLFEERLLEMQAQISQHAAEFEKGAALAREFQTNVLLSLPAPEQDLGSPLDQLTTRAREPIAAPRVA